MTHYLPIKSFLALSILWSLALTATAQQPAASSKWIPLFNGKTLDGWQTYFNTPREGNNLDRVFQVHDGAIHVYQDDADGAKVPKGYIASKQSYSRYHLRFQYKWGEKKFAPRYNMPRDAGLLYHITEVGRVWPRSFECQVQEGDTGDCITVQGTQLETAVAPETTNSDLYQYRPQSEGGILKTIGTKQNVRFLKAGNFETDGWNTVEVVVDGDRETLHIVNGHPTFQAKSLRKLAADDKTWQPVAAGRIAFQAEYAEVFYRNIEIQMLDDVPQSQVAIAPATIVNTQTQTPTPAAKLVPLPTVPKGFEIQIIAAPPLVEYPTLACFDDLGRLYVSEGANVNDEHPITSKTLPRSIRRLEDTDGDGVFDCSTVFADKMVFPYGGVFHNGALYVASDPSIWRLEDTDGDGVADKREIVITGFGAIGHASCVKGGYLGPDGWMYFCGGNDAGYDLTDRDGKHLKDPRPAPCVFRMKFNGTGLEYFANGAAGVYDLSFDPSGDLFGVVTILKYPRGDGLMHWVYGGVYESSRPTSRHAKLTGEKLPPLHEWPQLSPSGLVQYQSNAFGDDYRGNLFAAHFNTHVVTRNVVERAGATWKMNREESFIKSDYLNCRFTDVLEDADGSLIAVNTGGWFRIGCPTSEVGEGDLRGSIYRVRKTGHKCPADPRGLKIDWKNIASTDLAKQLDDARFVVRERTLAEFARRGAAVIPTLQATLKSSSAEARRNAVWALTRIDHPDARLAVRESLGDTNPTNQMAALHSVGLWRDEQAFDRIAKLLHSNRSEIRREAATALGRIGNAAGVPILLDQLAGTSDRFLEQAIIFAVIEIDSRQSTLAGLSNANPNIQRGALIALDQMRHGQLAQSEVTPLLHSTNFALLKAALNVVNRHDGWSEGVVEVARRWLEKTSLSKEEGDLLGSVLLKARTSAAMQELAAEKLAATATSTDVKRLLLDAMAKSRPKSLPASWQEPIETCLRSSDEHLARQAIATIAAIGNRTFQAQLQTVVLNAKAALPVRIDAAIAAVTTSTNSPSDEVFSFLTKHCISEQTEVVGRLSIAQTLGSANLTTAQLQRLVGTIAVAGPLELPSLLKPYEECQPPIAGPELTAALSKSPGLSSLSAVRIQRLIQRYPNSVQSAAGSLLKKISTDTESISVRMKELAFALDGGNAIRGQGLFAGKAACSQCHRIDKQGANIGPDLSKIGDIRTRRDLLEAIAFPSATFARGFEPVTVIASGRPLTGILDRETAHEVFLLTADRSHKAIPRDEIEEIVPARVSIMPQGLDRNLTPDELRDLLAFLASRKSKSN